MQIQLKQLNHVYKYKYHSNMDVKYLFHNLIYVYKLIKKTNQSYPVFGEIECIFSILYFYSTLHVLFKLI